MTALWTAKDAVAATGGKTGAAWQAHGVSIDTRTLQPGDLFVALIGEARAGEARAGEARAGEARDGHAFVADALAKGAAAALVSQDVPGVSAEKLLRVGDTLEGLNGLARAARARLCPGGRIAAVTGSVGKTSTKDALQAILTPQGTTHASVASYNNLWGVPLTLARMPVLTRFGIVEIGMNHAHEISPLTRLARPHVAIITTVEAVHLENFANIEGIADAKGEIFEGLEPGGTAVINRDNPYYQRLRGIAERLDAGCILSFGSEAGCDAQLLEVNAEATHSVVRAKIRGREIRYVVGVPGRHFVQNSLGILLVVFGLGADVEAAAQALAHVEATKGRGSRARIHVAGGSFELIDESYNANPVSMAAALSLLGQARPGPGGRRIAVIGDMLELGGNAPAFHAGLTMPIVASDADVIYCSGSLMAHLWAKLPARQRGAYAENSAILSPLVCADVRAGDVVMVKGSFGSRMDHVVDALRALNQTV